jgi:hypothetical protein
MNDAVSKLAVLQALGPLGEVEREAYNKVITLLQGNSPEVLEGLAPIGAFGFRGKPVQYVKAFVAAPLFEHLMWVEWPPERSKGAPLANHVARPPEASPDANGDWRMPNQNRIVKTRYLYLALVNEKGQVDFTDRWALPLTSTGLGFFDSDFASAYPMTIAVEGKEVSGPIASCKWRFSSELHNDGRNKWYRVKYAKGSAYGSPNGLTWDELLRGAEIEAEMKKADALARGTPAAQIEAKAAAAIPAAQSAAQIGAAKAAAARAAIASKITITSGKAAYDPGPPAPPPAPDEMGDGPGVKPPIDLEDEEIPY